MLCDLRRFTISTKAEPQTLRKCSAISQDGHERHEKAPACCLQGRGAAKRRKLEENSKLEKWLAVTLVKPVRCTTSLGKGVRELRRQMAFGFLRGLHGGSRCLRLFRPVCIDKQSCVWELCAQVQAAGVSMAVETREQTENEVSGATCAAEICAWPPSELQVLQAVDWLLGVLLP